MRATILWLSAVALLSCANSPALSPPSLITEPRVIAIIADPPAGAPGDVISLHALLAGINGTPTFRWWWCTPSVAIYYLEPQPSEECLAHGEGAHDLGSDATSSLTLPVDFIDSYYAALRAALPPDGGTPFPASRQLFGLVGVALNIVLEVDDGSGPVRAVKYVVATEWSHPNTNPELVYASASAGTSLIGDVRRSGMSPESDLCRGAPGRTDGTAFSAPAGQVISLNWGDPHGVEYYPTFIGGDGESGIESQPETSYCHLYGTAGQEVSVYTGSCVADEWQMPTTPGIVSMWFVVSDQRGGLSACSFTVRVE